MKKKPKLKLIAGLLCSVFQKGHHEFPRGGYYHVSSCCSATHFLEDFYYRRAEHNDCEALCLKELVLSYMDYCVQANRDLFRYTVRGFFSLDDFLFHGLQFS
ncbi:hypothetical protein SUGI_0117390 [Cryptomeria japonica]|nr:hypothetical protein SUGI_0117390 [Cryptomeria japonica]